MKHIMPMALFLSLTTTAAAAANTVQDAFDCRPVPEPVISLDHGSRYVAQDKSRSDFDETSNNDVNAQLKPVDTFISDLAVAANRAVSTADDRIAATECVVSGLLAWAKADALSNLATMNAQLSAPSRIAGLAFAYAQVKPFMTVSEDQKVIEDWFSDRARASMTYFDTEAPKNASRNNLRAWAGLAVARIGLTVEDDEMKDWADASIRRVACQAMPDGSLPLEMARRELALHYQLHAVAPMVVAAVLLQADGRTLFTACDRAIHRTITFVLDGFEDKTLVEAVTGYPQSYFNGTEELRSFELAWASAYLSVFSAPRLSAFVEEYGDLGNSKLGGRQSLLWGL